MKNKLVSVVIPAHNKEENITVIIDRIEKVFASLDYNYEVIIVDDGCSDNTLAVVKSLAEKDSKILYIEFSKNFGKDNALKAGLDVAKGDAIVMIDADLQHPPELIIEMLKMWEKGYEVIYAYRKEDNPDASFKNKIASKLFYQIINKISDINLENGIADFRLVDKKVIEVLSKIDEYELFLRGIVKWVGFKQIGLPYIPNKRFDGKSNYSTVSLIKLALHGLTSFSTKPLYSAIYIGFTFSILSTLYIPYVLYSYFYSLEVSGWASLIVTVVFFGGLQLIILGIIGIYVGKMFIQTKNRPNYIIRSTNLKK